MCNDILTKSLIDTQIIQADGPHYWDGAVKRARVIAYLPMACTSTTEWPELPQRG